MNIRHDLWGKAVGGRNCPVVESCGAFGRLTGKALTREKLDVAEDEEEESEGEIRRSEFGRSCDRS